MQTKPALKVLILYSLGILTGRILDLPILIVVAFCILSLFAAFTLWYADKGQERLKALCLAGSLVSVGFLQYQFSCGFFPENHISNFTNLKNTVSILGIIVRYPEKRLHKINLTLDVTEVIIAQEQIPTEGKILISLQEQNNTFRYGDKIVAHGRLRRPSDKRNPGEFDYREYLQAQGIFGLMSVYQDSQIEKISSGDGAWLLQHLVFPVKDYLVHFIDKNFPQKEAALLQGLLIGERGEVSSELRQAFAKMGVIHILAVSGLHVGFIILIFFGVLGFLRIPYTMRVLLTVAGLVFYAYLTNLKPPVVRASIMGGLIILGTVLQRRTDIYNTLALAALMILIVNPLELFQSGFQLSFIAVLAIVYFYPKFRDSRLYRKVQEKVPWKRIFRYPSELLLVSLAAFLGTLPFTILYFHRLPNFSLFANLLIVPFAFCGLANGIAAAVCNLFLVAVAKLYSAASWFFLHSLIKFVEWGSQFKFAAIEIYKVTLPQILLYLTGVLLLANLHQKKVRRWFLIYGLVFANFLVWNTNFSQNNKLSVAFLDVGQGDAALLTFPGKRHLLIDGGMRSQTYDAGQWVIAPYLKREGIEEIDALVLSHADADHLGGFPYILRNFKVREVWDNGQGKDTELYHEFVALIDSLKIPRRILKTGDCLDIFDPVKIFVVHPTEPFLKTHDSNINESSLSLKVSFGQIDFLFAGDVEKDGETQIARFGDLLGSEVLKVSHHGSRTSSIPSFLNSVHPQQAVISVGELNKFGHPDETVLSRLQATDTQILRTDRDAAIILQTDGQNIKRIFWK